MKKRLLVTGLNGFVGRAIQRYIKANSESLDLNLVEPQKKYDVRNENDLREMIEATSPDYIIHLAAQSFVPDSFSNPHDTFDINFYGTLNLLEAAKNTGFPGRLLFIGSGDTYGLVGEEDLPIYEKYPLRPRNPYAVSKVAAEALCYQWSQTDNFDVIMARPFNHIGPGQDERFVIADFAKQLVSIKYGKQPAEITVGNIDVTRDFTDVRDVVRAYLMLLDKGRNGQVYNVCSGKEYSIRYLLTQLLSIVGVDANIVQDSARFRTSEQKRLYGNYDLLKQHTGWFPEVDTMQSLSDIVTYWSERYITT